MHEQSTVIQLAIVGGCGRVGLPLGLAFARTGRVCVTLIDINEDKVSQINSGSNPYMEDGASALLKELGGKSLHATSSPAGLKDADCVVMVIGTPIDQHLNPTVYTFKADLDRVVTEMKDGSLLVLRSTIYPGVTKMVYDTVQELSRKIHVAFCPERIAEGKALEELISLPQIVSAFEPESMQKAKELFMLVAGQVIELQPLEAELAKLFTNSWRYLNFAISNQFYMIAQNSGVDFYKIYKAMTEDYPRMRSFARAGFAAGPCLLKDTIQLSTFAHNNFFLGTAAMLVNESMPNFVLNQLSHLQLSTKTVAILGMAFKGDSDDRRDSLSYKLKKILTVSCRKVLCSDPYVDDANLVSLETAIAQAEIIIIGAPHTAYRALTFPADKEVVDVWGIWHS
jgi:UDP-N-acetyl-D-mannosaminuronic acid dehydrogenase